MQKQLLILFMGPSGSGKGTQAKMISAEQGFDYVEMGGILREQAKKNDELGKKIDYFIHQKGILVPDEIVKDLIQKILLSKDENKGIILDGYPRNEQQVNELDEILKKMPGERKLIVFNIQISDDEAMKRLTQRRICVDCKNVLPADSKDENCPKCGGKLEHRSDDNPEKIQERLKWAHEKVQPAILEYEKRGVLEQINGERPINVVHEDIVGRLKKIL